MKIVDISQVKEVVHHLVLIVALCLADQAVLGYHLFKGAQIAGASPSITCVLHSRDIFFEACTICNQKACATDRCGTVAITIEGQAYSEIAGLIELATLPTCT